MKNGDRVISLYPGTEGLKGTIISAQHKKPSKDASPGWLHKIKWDNMERKQLYHEIFLRVITPLEELL